jgi:hypothetical protein
MFGFLSCGCPISTAAAFQISNGTQFCSCIDGCLHTDHTVVDGDYLTAMLFETPRRCDSFKGTTLEVYPSENLTTWNVYTCWVPPDNLRIYNAAFSFWRIVALGHEI